MSAQAQKPNDPNSVDFFKLRLLKNINKNEKTSQLHVLASLCSLSIRILTSFKLIAPFKDFPPYYKSDFASLKKGSSFQIAFIAKEYSKYSIV